MIRKKIKRLAAFLIAASMSVSLCGCNVIDEQWKVVEQYRLENTTTEDASLTEATTTVAAPEQYALADFIDEDETTLRGRIIVPNGYTRVNLSSEEEVLEAQSLEKRIANATNDKASGAVSSDASKDAVSSDALAVSGDAVSSGDASGVTSLASADGASTSETLTTQNATQSDATSAAEQTTEQVTTEQVTTEQPDNTSGKTSTIEEFMRALPVKNADGQVLLYNGQAKEQQDSYVAVLNMALDSNNLQQRGSSMMRLYAEYYWSNQKYDCMQYHLTNGFLMDYDTWIKGYRITVSNNTASWYDYGQAGDNYPTLLAYLENYFCYSGMSSLLAESHAVTDKVAVGDYFVDEQQEYAAMVVDVAENESGERCFLLAAGGSPGQDIEILKNPAHENPWYYESECSGTFSTPEFDLDGKTRYHLTTSESTASGDASGDVSGEASGDASGNASGDGGI